MATSANATVNTPPGVSLTEPVNAQQPDLLSGEALAFVAQLERRFGARRRELLEARKARQARLDAGEMPDFLASTREIRDSDWQVRAAPPDLRDRRVEITGPVDAKMVINALNSGANCFMADFEDAHSPTWQATLAGQASLYDAVRRQLTYTSPDGRQYALGEELATLLVRPRGWHLTDKHLLVDGERISGGLFDFGLYLFHNARELLARGTGAYFYLPKMESHLEARLWADVFAFSQEHLQLPEGTIRCTVLIETILAGFEMDEILWELRDFIVGLNCGRWDYIFSFIKRFARNPDWVLPDRSQVTMDKGFLQAYSLLLIQTCHRRGAHAMGGMAAQIPIKDDPTADAAAKEKVRADKVREARNGHDGTWVAHPGLVDIAREVFDQYMPAPNQLDKLRQDVTIAAADLLALPQGQITEAGMRNNVSAALRYMTAWLCGQGAVPINNLMEDAATAEIARSQLWQWVRYPAGRLDDGRDITPALFGQTLDAEVATLGGQLDDDHTIARMEQAAQLLRNIVLSDDFEEFLTLPAYELLD